MTEPKRPLAEPAEAVVVPEIRALRLVIEDKPNAAQNLIDTMSGRDRALFTYYLRELGLMIENADFTAEVNRRRPV